MRSRVHTIAQLPFAILAAAAFALAGCGDKDPAPAAGEVGTPAVADKAASAGPAAPGLEQPPPPSPIKRHPPETVLITVNGKELTQADLDKAISASFRGMPADSPQLAGLLPRVLPQIEEQLIEQTLLEEAAAKAGTAPTDEEVVAKFDELVKTQLPPGADVDAKLKEQGMTREAFHARMRTGMSIEKFLEQLPGSKLAVDDAAVRTFYDAHLDDFKVPERVKARHILIKLDPKATPEQKAEKRKLIDSLQQKLAKDATEFSALAAEHSSCPSKAQGGDLGFFGRGQMVPPFEEAAFGLPVGGISGVVETQFGYHVIAVDEHQEAGTKPFEEAAPEIRTRLSQEAREKAVKAALADLKEKAVIVRAEFDAGGSEAGAK